ncbi:putative UPF0481 protein [Tanacetum coccineum]
MEQKKLIVVQCVLQDRRINDFNFIIDKIRKLVPLVRACYDMSLHDDDDSLAWVFAIDGVFLLEVISSNKDGRFHFPYIQDILMMENQIPFEVLKEIDEALMQPSSEVVLPNLVAYEMLVAKSDEFPLTEYVTLMCGCQTVHWDEQLYTKHGKEKEKEIRVKENDIEEANRVYERRLSMKASFLMKKLASWLLVILKAIGGFVESSWKIVAFMIRIGTVILLTWQAYCDTYGCEKTNVTLLAYVSR